MDLGIKGKKALVCASSKGLGRASAMALAQNGVDLTICARTPQAIEATAEEIRSATGATVHAIACDITTVDGREKALAPFDANLDILVNNLPAARRRAISGTGRVMTGSRPLMPIC